MQPKRAIVLLAAAGLALLGLGPAAPAALVPILVPAASAQELTWERVGDIAVDATGIDFGPDGTLWAAGYEIYRLPPGAAVWEVVCDHPGCAGNHVLALGNDTLLVVTGGIRRSTDGGQTWHDAFFGWAGVLHETPLGGPNRGLLLTGTVDSVGTAYSRDRGATWAYASIRGNNVIAHDATGFGELPYGHPHAGRLVASAYGGLRYSDDGGATWTKSDVYDDGFRYGGSGVAVTADGRVHATLADATLPNVQRYVSEDGAHWTHTGSLPDWPAYLVAVEGGPDPSVGVLFAVTSYEAAGPGVYRSEDGGETWARVGTVPVVVGESFVQEILVGPDGRLYVAATRSGVEKEWVYRTAEPIVTASEPEPPETLEGPAALLPAYPNPSSGVTTVPFVLARPGHVRLAVYDVLGREVAVLVDGRLDAGAHEAALDAGRLPAGVYVVRLAAGGVVAAQTVTLLR